MDRLALPSSELHLYVTPLTAHRLFAASLIIAIKFIAKEPPSGFDDRHVIKPQLATNVSIQTTLSIVENPKKTPRLGFEILFFVFFLQTHVCKLGVILRSRYGK